MTKTIKIMHHPIESSMFAKMTAKRISPFALLSSDSAIGRPSLMIEESNNSSRKLFGDSAKSLNHREFNSAYDPAKIDGSPFHRIALMKNKRPIKNYGRGDATATNKNTPQPSFQGNLAFPERIKMDVMKLKDN